MTVEIKGEIVNGYYFYIEQDKYSSAYKVGVCRMIDTNMAGYPLNEKYYGDLTKANRRYRDLRKQYD